MQVPEDCPVLQTQLSPVFLQRTARTETPAVPQSVPLQMCDGFWSDFPQESPPCFPIQIQPPPGLPRECHRSCIFQFQDSELLQDSPGETVPPKTSDSAGGRSEERRVGKECRARWSRENVKKRKGEWIAQATKERKRA